MTIRATVLAQQAKDPQEILRDDRFLWGSLALVGVLLFGAWVFSRLDRWRKKQMDGADDGTRESFGSFRAMYERGQITRDEYDRLLRRAAERVAGKPAPPVLPPDLPPPAPTTPPEPTV